MPVEMMWPDRILRARDGSCDRDVVTRASRRALRNGSSLRDPKTSVFGLKLVTSITRVSPSQWANVGRQVGASVHDDVALPALALPDVVEDRDAARGLHDPAETAGVAAKHNRASNSAPLKN